MNFHFVLCLHKRNSKTKKKEEESDDNKMKQKGDVNTATGTKKQMEQNSETVALKEKNAKKHCPYTSISTNRQNKHREACRKFSDLFVPYIKISPLLIHCPRSSPISRTSSGLKHSFYVYALIKVTCHVVSSLPCLQFKPLRFCLLMNNMALPLMLLLEPILW